jgi:predicted alpha/beta-fold hydrolase
MTPFHVRPFHRPWWLRGAHPQTVSGRLLRRARPIALQRERLELPDGDFVDLDLAPGTEGAPLVLLTHGLEGSARRGYALNTYHELAQYGLRGVGLNFRSCSGEPNRTARLYHSGDTADIRFVLEQLAQRFPHAPRGAIGFSLGGNALLKLLGEAGANGSDLVSAAVAVSVPFDLAAGARILDSNVMGRFYTRLFLKSLRLKAVQKSDLIRDRCDLERVANARSFWEFDDAATAPLHGFAGAEDYYARSSSAQFLERIRVPTLILHSADDPFLPASAIPRAAIARNAFLVDGVQEHGGHVGFITGTPLHPIFWAESEGARFLAAHLSKQ